MPSVPGTKEIAYFDELNPEQLIGYVPTGLDDFAEVTQASDPLREAGVSPLVKPLNVALFNPGVAWPYS